MLFQLSLNVIAMSVNDYGLMIQVDQDVDFERFDLNLYGLSIQCVT